MSPTILIAAAAAAAATLTIPSGQTMLFRIERGRPVAVRQVAPTTAPARGEIRFTVKAMMGTMLTVINNSPTAYTFRATLVAADGKAMVANSCVLPAGNRLAMENWPQQAVAVRVGDFRPTRAANCR